MVNGRRLWTTVSFVVDLDEVLPDRSDASGKADVIGDDSLREDPVLHSCDLVDILFGAVEKDQNRRYPVHGAKHCPISLADSGKATTDDVMRLLREHLLRNCATPALK